MGFLSKLLKKAKPFLPIALSMFGPGLMAGAGAKFGLGSLFSGMNPMARNMLMQSAMGYGTAALSGSKRPGKAAMYAGLASLPFSYMSAANAANAFNQRYGDVQGMERYYTPASGGPVYGGEYGKVISRTPFKPAVEGFREMTGGAGRVPKISAWDVLRGKAPEGMPTNLPDTLRTEGYRFSDKAIQRKNPLFGRPGETAEYLYEDIAPGKFLDLPGADIFTKDVPLTNKAGDILGFESKANWLPTAAAQAAAMYGGRMTPEEEWEASKKKRKKELAWMYGVPEEMIEGEMTNPWASGSFWNRGGIASLENGGDVSGPGSGTSDSINANLSDGEFVMTAKAVENLGGGDRYAGARKMYDLMNVLDPESETMSEVV